MKKMTLEFNGWREYATFWLNPATQMSTGWLKAREKRLTCSNFGTAVGLNNFQSADDYLQQLLTGSKPDFSLAAKIAIAHGVKMEPEARRWYEKQTGEKVREVGLAVPKWDTALGGSPDGLVGEEGMIEIKCPQKMYWPLIQFCERVASGEQVEDFEHIWPSHYAQMQGCMAIFGRAWCDYIVYVPHYGATFMQRIPFDATYWADLYAKLCLFRAKLLAGLQTNGQSKPTPSENE